MIFFWGNSVKSMTTCGCSSRGPSPQHAAFNLLLPLDITWRTGSWTSHIWSLPEWTRLCQHPRGYIHTHTHTRTFTCPISSSLGYHTTVCCFFLLSYVDYLISFVLDVFEGHLQGSIDSQVKEKSTMKAILANFLPGNSYNSIPFPLWVMHSLWSNNVAGNSAGQMMKNMTFAQLGKDKFVSAHLFDCLVICVDSDPDKHYLMDEYERVPIAVCEREPSSIIAFALRSQSKPCPEWINIYINENTGSMNKICIITSIWCCCPSCKKYKTALEDLSKVSNTGGDDSSQATRYRDSR